MDARVESKRKYSSISFISLAIGITCFFIVFVPVTRIANTGNEAKDTVTLVLTAAGILFSLVALVNKTEKKLIAILGLLLSLSFFIFWIIALILLFTGKIEFAP